MQRYAILLSSLLAVLCSGAEQRESDKSEVPTQVVDHVRHIVQTIKECPSELILERKRGKDSMIIIGRFFAGPPQNVVWDIAPNKSVRSPYAAYIEFVIATSVSPSPNATYKKAVSLEQEKRAVWPKPTQYRYEFDAGNDRLELMKVLSRAESETDWKTAHLEGRCWGRAAQNNSK